MSKSGKRLKFCSSLLLIVAIVVIIFGVFYCFTPKPLPYHLDFMGISFEEIQEFNPQLAELLMIFIKLAGTCFIGLGIIVAGIAFEPFRKAEKWSWIVTFSGSIIVLVPLLAMTIYVGALAKWVVAITLLLLLIALFVPIKDFFRHN
ncbi:MAG: hypothetical protein GY861_06830 [bacterium]|nr:hypothetical protein [bacterium]